eukprot:347172-Chlamydomonas_euryale.AAC.1
MRAAGGCGCGGTEYAPRASMPRERCNRRLWRAPPSPSSAARNICRVPRQRAPPPPTPSPRHAARLPTLSLHPSLHSSLYPSPFPAPLPTCAAESSLPPTPARCAVQEISANQVNEMPHTKSTRGTASWKPWTWRGHRLRGHEIVARLAILLPFQHCFGIPPPLEPDSSEGWRTPCADEPPRCSAKNMRKEAKRRKEMLSAEEAVPLLTSSDGGSTSGGDAYTSDSSGGSSLIHDVDAPTSSPSVEHAFTNVEVATPSDAASDDVRMTADDKAIDDLVHHLVNHMFGRVVVHNAVGKTVSSVVAESAAEDMVADLTATSASAPMPSTPNAHAKCDSASTPVADRPRKRVTWAAELATIIPSRAVFADEDEEAVSTDFGAADDVVIDQMVNKIVSDIIDKVVVHHFVMDIFTSAVAKAAAEEEASALPVNPNPEPPAPTPTTHTDSLPTSAPAVRRPATPLVTVVPDYADFLSVLEDKE